MLKFDGRQWVAVGKPGFSDGPVTHGQLVISSQNIPYVSYVDGAHGNKATVMKFDGHSWVTVGEPGFTDNRLGCATTTLCGSLAINANGTPYFAYNDFTFGYKTTVMKFDGNQWVAVGQRGFSIGQGWNENLVINPKNQEPCVAYNDTYDPVGRARGVVSCYQ